MNAAATPAKPHRMEIWGNPSRQKKSTPQMACLFKKTATQGSIKNNDIYMVNDEEGDIYKEPKERHPRVLYKLKVCKNPISKNMPHKEEFDDDNYESIDETTV